MAQITDCKIDRVRVTSATIDFDSGDIRGEVAFLAGERPAGTLTVSGLGVLAGTADVVQHLRELLERGIAADYGTLPSEDPKPAVTDDTAKRLSSVEF